MIINRRKSFDKSWKKLDRKIQTKAIDALNLFEINPFDDKLNNHKLSGDCIGFRSINVTGDYRILFVELSKNRYELIELVEIGAHSQLYK